MDGSRNRVLSIVAVVLGVAMVGSGLSKLAGESHQVTSFALFGLPPWFRALVGTFEIVGALLLFARATRPAGSLVLSTIMVGALWAHLAHAEWLNLLPVGLLLTLFLAIFWHNRPRAVRLLGGVVSLAPAPYGAQRSHGALDPLVARDLSPAYRDQAVTRHAEIAMSGSSRAVVWFARFVLAAAALRCIGGQMQGRLILDTDEKRERAAKMGVKDPRKKYAMEDMVQGDCLFAATGVTDGSMLRGVRFGKSTIETETVVMRSVTGTVRWIKAEHRQLGKFHLD